MLFSTSIVDTSINIMDSGSSGPPTLPPRNRSTFEEANSPINSESDYATSADESEVISIPENNELEHYLSVSDGTSEVDDEDENTDKRRSWKSIRAILFLFLLFGLGGGAYFLMLYLGEESASGKGNGKGNGNGRNRTTEEPTAIPTIGPTGQPTTTAPTTLAPSKAPTTPNPTMVPTTSPFSTPRPTCTPSFQLDLLMVLDESRSVGKSNYELLTNILADFVESLDFSGNAFRIGVVEFSGIPDLVGTQNQIPYPNTNLKEVAIQTTINLDDYNEGSKSELVERIRTLTYSSPDALGGVVEAEPEYQGENERSQTCISCAFQYLKDEYFQNASNVGSLRDRYILFIGDGEANRGTPESPVDPVKDLRDAFPFRMVFIPVTSTDGSFSEAVFGSAYNSTIDVTFPVNSYGGLNQTFQRDIEAEEVFCDTGLTI